MYFVDDTSIFLVFGISAITPYNHFPLWLGLILTWFVLLIMMMVNILSLLLTLIYLCKLIFKLSYPTIICNEFLHLLLCPYRFVLVSSTAC